jgi:hypothetical protein
MNESNHPPEPPKTSNGIAALAGGWTQADCEEFERNTAEFSRIDCEMWR